MLHSSLHCAGVKNLFLLCRILGLELTLLIIFKVIDSRDNASSNIQLKHVTFWCCLIWLTLYLMIKFGIFLFFSLETKRIDSVLSSPRRKNQSPRFVKSSFNQFWISLILFPWKARQESSAYETSLILLLGACHTRIIRHNKRPRIDPCGTPHVMFEGME